MQAAWLTDRQRFELRDLDLPAPAADEVRVEVLGCGVCGSNLHDWHRPGPGAMGIAGAVGHEMVGRIDELGEVVTDVAVGEIVVVDPSAMGGCGQCAACRDGAGWFCSAKLAVPAYGFATHIITPARALHVVPDGLDPTAAALTEPVACGVHAVRHSWTARESGRVDGLDVVVLGAGVLGLGSLVAALELGAASVTVVARHPHQADASNALGATTVLDSEGAGLAAELRRLRAPLVIEAVGGSADTLRLAADIVAWRGEVVCVGAFAEPQALDVGRMMARETRMFVPVSYSARDGVHDFEVALNIIATSGRPLQRLATHHVPLDDIGEAFAIADDKRSGALRVVVGQLSG